MQPILRREPKPWRVQLVRMGLGISGTIAVACLIYYLLRGIDHALGAAAPYATTAVVVALYLIAAYMAAKSPDLPADIDVENPHRSTRGRPSRQGCISCCDRHADWC